MKNMFGDIKKSIKEDARKTYQHHNKCTIFDREVVENTKDLRKQKLKAEETLFSPKFEEVSSHARKFKEVWNPNADKEDLKAKNINSTFGNYSKQFANKGEGVENPHQLDPRKRKLAELNPKLREDDIQKVSESKGTETFYAGKSMITDNGPATTHRDAKVKSLQSNIFNDLDKNEDPYPNQRRGSLPPPSKGNQENSQKLGLGKYPKVERVNDNYGHIMKTAEPNCDQLENVDSGYNAKKMKQMNLLSNLDPNNVKRNVVEYIPKGNDRFNKENNEKQNNEIPGVPLTQSKAKKLVSLAGNLGSGSAFSKNENQEREIQEFKVESDNGFHFVEQKRIKSIFARNGLHIYDMCENGKYNDGFNKGVLTFKVRLNEEKPEFDYKLNKISSDLNKLNLDIKKYTQSFKKPITDLVPTNVSWSHEHLNLFSDKRIEKNENKEDKKKLGFDEKLSNEVIQKDTLYKNSFGDVNLNGANVSQILRKSKMGK